MSNADSLVRESGKQPVCQFISPSGARRLAGAIVTLLISTMLAGVNVAHAGCMKAPTQKLQSLAELAGQDPAAVIAATTGGKTEADDSLSFGWRQAARAEAFDTLSRPAEARRTALGVIEQETDLRTPLHVELLTRYAMNGFRTEEIEHATSAVDASRRGQVRGSAADACLEIALGEMQRMRGAPERAVVHLADAYRATSDPHMKQQHVLATEKLARVIGWAGDNLQAISLIEEVIAWDGVRGRTVALSNDFYFRGSFNLARGDYPAALADFERSRAFASSAVDPVGSGFLDLQTCATLIELSAFDRAKALCQRADATFRRYGEIAGAQAQLLLARVAFAQNEPQQALTTLNTLLSKDDVLSSFASKPQAYRLRSDVNRRLGRTGAAYRDLDIYVHSVERMRTSEQARQSAVLRASFNADRIAERNQDLQQRLYFSNEREREEAQRYTVLAASAAIGAVMLLIILGMSVYHRRKLTRIANTDPLTGLANRRFINEHQKAFMSDNARSGEPLSVAIIDIDHFKAINDTYGHSAGDEVLIAFARLARTILRGGDVIARWGGEEFIVILPHATKHEAVEALERLRVALTPNIHTASGSVAVRFSAGIATVIGSEELQTLIQSADHALYRAKAGGRNRIENADVAEPPARDNDTVLDHRKGSSAASA